METDKIKLNLGCGTNKLDGFINVDKTNICDPDIIHDLEKFPYPFKDNSVKEIILSHVLEHLGQNPEVFNLIIKEFYRICENGAIIDIRVPHPRHDNFLSDPTHVRPITIMTLSMYDKELNKVWEKEGSSNTPLGIINNVNFKIKKAQFFLDENYEKLIKENKIKKENLDELAHKYNNVIKELKIIWSVVK